MRRGRLTTVSGRQRYPICDTATAPLAETNHRRDEANARLIAAAPDLAEALRPFADAILHLHYTLPDDGLTLDGFKVSDIRRAYAALAKAHGQ